MIVKKRDIELKVVESKLGSTNEFWNNHFSFWEEDTFDFIFKYLDKEKIFIDIGAWIGPISLIAAQHSKQCICFEPDEIAYNEFIQNIELNNIKNISLENKAISIHKQIQLGAPSLGESMTRDECNENSKTYECLNLLEIFTKYNILEKDVSVLKIDVEGHESELLQDKFLWDLNVPMYISLHPFWKSNKEKFYQDIIPFFEHKGINIFDKKHFKGSQDTNNFFEIEIDI